MSEQDKRLKKLLGIDSEVSTDVPRGVTATEHEHALRVQAQEYETHIAALESELAASKRECEGLREVVFTAYNMSADAIELNHDYYTEEQVFQLNNEMIELFLYLLKDERSVAAREAAEQALAARDATEGVRDV